jgi:drug/metabolite transporter (DMT)-like permease
MAAPLSSTGLLFATAASISNVGFDIAAKHALSGRTFLQTTLFLRCSVATLFSLIVFGYWLHGSSRSSIVLFQPGLSVVLQGRVLPVLLLSTGLVTVSILLYYRSLQTAPLSITAPLFSFTPVFVLMTGFLVFHHLPSVRIIAGVLCILLGSLQVHWNPNKRSLLSVMSSFLRERGVLMMLGACLLLSITNLLDQWLVLRMDVLTYAWLYAVLCALFTLCLAPILRPRSVSAPPRKGWIALAAAVDTVALLLHFASLQYVDAVVTIAIKRSGLLLSVLAGSLFFREPYGRQRMAAGSVVLIGVFMIYFEMHSWTFAAALIAAIIVSILGLVMARSSSVRQPAPSSIS